MKYVWYNVETGKFSNSWGEDDHEQAGGTERLLDPKYHSYEWKLIRYESLGDDNFEFNDLMRIK